MIHSNENDHTTERSDEHRVPVQGQRSDDFMADGGSHESDDYLACKHEQWMTHGGQFYGDLSQLIELVQRPGKADGGEIRYAVWNQRGVIYWGRDQDFMGRQVLFGQSLALKAKLFEINILPVSPSGSRFCEG